MQTINVSDIIVGDGLAVPNQVCADLRDGLAVPNQVCADLRDGLAVPYQVCADLRDGEPVPYIVSSTIILRFSQKILASFKKSGYNIHITNLFLPILKFLS